MTEQGYERADGMARGARRLFVDVSEKAAENLNVLATKAGVSRNLYVNQLFNAAYAARCAPTGDRELDAATRPGAPLVPAKVVSISPAPATGAGRAVDEFQLQAAKAREKALGAELETARKSLSDYAGQIGNAARIERESEALKTQLAEARAKVATLTAAGEAAKRDREELAGLRVLLAAARGEIAAEKDRLKAALALRDRESEELADQIEAAEATIGELRAQVAAAPVAAISEVAPVGDLTEAARALVAALRADLASAESAMRDYCGVIEAAAKVWRGTPGFGVERASVETLAEEVEAPSSVSLREPPSPARGEGSAPVALTTAEVKIVRGYAAAGASARKIAAWTGFPVSLIEATLKKRAA